MVSRSIWRYAVLMSELATLRSLREEVERIIKDCGQLAKQLESRILRCRPCYRASAENLAHYLGLRTLDLRKLQLELGRLGLSSLGRSEGHVLQNLHQVARRLDDALSDPSHRPATLAGIGVDEAEKLRHQHTIELFGSTPSDRHVLVMVTSPAACDVTQESMAALLRAGMNCLRINCSVGSALEWRQVAEQLRLAQAATGLPCRLLFDLPGPKIRTRALLPGPQVLHVRRNKNELGQTTEPSLIRLGPQGEGILPIDTTWTQQLEVSDTIRFVDSSGRRRKLTVTEKHPDQLVAACSQSFYLTPGTPLQWFRGDIQLGEKPCGAIAAKPYGIELAVGDLVTLIEGEKVPHPPSTAVFGLNIPGLLASVDLHDRVVFDDGKINGVVVEKSEGFIRVQIAQAQAQRVSLKDKKGVSFPDSTLPVHFLTETDIQALDTVIDLADLVAFSFVRSATEVRQAVELIGSRRNELGIVIKLETQQGVDHLADILFELMTHAPVGLMIARGDLAVECGFERLAELQEELLWLCEAAHLPVIWATQVLETLTQTGIPTRAEITDAAMAMRAECVMLNRGPHLLAAMTALVDIIKKMEHHQHKKRQLYRPLHIAEATKALLSL